MKVRTGHGLPADRALPLACGLLFGAMFNLTLVVAGLKELVIEELGGTATDAALFFTIETLAYILFAPLWGLVSDRLGRRRVMIVAGFALSAVVYAAYLTVESVGMLLVLRFAQGAFAVMGWSLVMAVVVDRSEATVRGRVMGMMGASLIAGVAVGAPFGGYLTRWYGARAPLAAAALIFALLAALALFLRDSRSLVGMSGFGRLIGALLERPRLLLPFSFHFVDRLAVGLFVVVFPLYLDSLGAEDPAVRGRYLSYFLVPFALFQYWTGRMAERSGPYVPLLLGSLLYGLALSLVGYADLVALRPLMALLGALAAVMFPPAILLTAEFSSPETRASAMGGFNLAGSLGFAVGPILGVWASGQRGFPFAFVVCGVAEIALVLVAAAVVFGRWRRSEVTQRLGR